MRHAFTAIDPDSEWLTAVPSGRAFVRTFKYQRRSRRAYSEHGSHSLARRTPSGVSDDKPASWNAVLGAVSRATSSAILASICVIVKIGLRQRYPTSA
jgi:hypothetical protein